MARSATGTIIERRNATDGINCTLRFSVNGRKRAVALGPVTRTEAEERLRHELADVERDVWKPPVRERVWADAPTFHAYAEQWWRLTEAQLSENTQADYRRGLRSTCSATSATRHDQGGDGRGLHRREARGHHLQRRPRGQQGGPPALRAVDHHDGDPARGDPRAGGEARADPTQRGEGLPGEGTRAGPLLAGDGRPDPRAAGRGRRAGRQRSARSSPRRASGDARGAHVRGSAHQRAAGAPLA
jgi:hypothetical protein